MIRVLVDSSADYTKEQVAERNIEMIPMTITIDEDKSYRDEIDLTRDELFEMMIEGGKVVKTSQPSPQDFVDAFQKAKDQGDELICILLSSALSGTYQSALLAKNMVEYDKIYIIDSLSATLANQILADHALKLIEEGLQAPEIVAKLEVLKGKIRILAGVDTLKYLYLGGRVSKATAIVADAVSVKPGIVVTKEGTVGVTGKYLGVGRAIKDLVKQTKNAKINRDFPLYLIYSYEKKNMDKLQKAMDDAGIQVDRHAELGATIGVHIGPGAFGIIFVEE